MPNSFCLNHSRLRMEVTGRRFQDLTNTSHRRCQQALQTLKQGTSNKVLNRQTLLVTVSRGTSAAESSRVPTHLHQSADSICSSCNDHSRGSSHRHSRQQHRRRVACIVVEQWKWFTQDRKATNLASRHHKHRLQLSAILALQNHAKHCQLEWRRAAIFNHRRQYMLQGKCLLLWQAQLNNSKKLQQQLAKATAARHRTQQQLSLTCWKHYQGCKRQHRKANLQAKYYRSFVLLSSALQQWKTAAQMFAEKQRKRQSAISLYSARRLCTVFKAWLVGVEVQQHAQRAQQQAAEHHRVTLMSSIVQHWHSTVRDFRAARGEGSTAMQVNLNNWRIPLMPYFHNTIPSYDLHQLYMSPCIKSPASALHQPYVQPWISPALPCISPALGLHHPCASPDIQCIIAMPNMLSNHAAASTSALTTFILVVLAASATLTSSAPA